MLERRSITRAKRMHKKSEQVYHGQRVGIGDRRQKGLSRGGQRDAGSTSRIIKRLTNVKSLGVELADIKRECSMEYLVERKQMICQNLEITIINHVRGNTSIKVPEGPGSKCRSQKRTGVENFQTWSTYQRIYNWTLWSEKMFKLIRSDDTNKIMSVTESYLLHKIMHDGIVAVEDLRLVIQRHLE